MFFELISNYYCWLGFMLVSGLVLVIILCYLAFYNLINYIRSYYLLLNSVIQICKLGSSWDAIIYQVIVIVPYWLYDSLVFSLAYCWTLKIEASNGALLLLNLQVIPAFEEAVSGMTLGGIRRCCICFSERAYYQPMLFLE